MNLFVYWEYMQNAQKVEYLGEFETKSKIFLDVYQEPR